MFKPRYEAVLVILAFVAPAAICWLLTPVRDELDPTNAALVLVLVVVAFATTGRWAPGIIAALSSGVWFDFFLTRPYEAFTIDDRDDIVTAILLLLVGIGTTALAVWGRRQQAAASRNEGFLEGIATASQSVAAGDLAPSALIDRVCAELTTVLGLRSCRFDFGTGLDRPHLHRDGRVTWRHQVWDVRVGVPATHGALELWAQTGGSFRGRFLLEVNDGFRMSTGQLRLATSLADDVAAALAGYDARTP